MRRALGALLLVVIAACSRSTPTEPPPPPPPQRERPLAQDGTPERAITSAPDRTRVELDLAAVRRGIQLYKSEHGAWPASLSQVSIEGGLSYPQDLSYDAATGSVRSQTYPSY